MTENAYIKDLKSYDDLSYNDYGDDYVELMHKNIIVDDVEVFTDRTNEERMKQNIAEYILVNDEMIYLDSIKKHV